MQEKVSFNDINRSHRPTKIHAGSRPWSINNNFARRNARNAVLEKVKAFYILMETMGTRLRYFMISLYSALLMTEKVWFNSCFFYVEVL